MANPSRSWHRLIPAAALVFAAVAAVAFAFGVASGHGATAFAADPTATASVPGHPELGTGWRMGRGFHMGGMGGAIEITITAIDGNELSLKTTDGWTRTIDATGATVTKAGQTIQIGDLKVGDTIDFREARQTDGSYKITTIDVVLPQVAGTVSGVTSSSVTITQFDGSSRTVQLNGSTVYKQAGNTVDHNALVTGARIVAVGTSDSAGTLTAQTIEIMPAVVSGTVSSKTADTIVVKTADGKTVNVKVTSSTKYQVRGQTSPSLSNVAVGDAIVAEGSLDSDGSLTAGAVRAGVADQPGFGGRGGFGPWTGQGMPGFGPGFRGHMGSGMGPGSGTAPGSSSAPSSSASPASSL